MSVALRLPCIEFEARVFPYGEKSPSMIEQAALSYVLGGTAVKPILFDDLEAFLGLGRPAVLELVIKLWRRGWVMINLESRVLELAPQLKQFIAGKSASNRFQGLGTTEPPETLDFAYDLVCGQVFPKPRSLLAQGDQRFTYGPGPDPSRPFEMPLDGFTNVSTADFTQALREHPAYRRLSKDNNLEYRIVRPESVLTPAAAEYYRLEFEVFRTPQGEFLLRSVDENPILSRIGRVLGDAIVHGPATSDPFMRKMLEEHAEEREPTLAVQLSSPTVRFRELVRQIQGAGSEASQAELEARARSLWPEIEFEVSCAANNELAEIDPLANSIAVHGALQRGIAPGFEQAVLVSQTCNYEALVGGEAADTPPTRGHLSMLSDAMSGEGRLFLQWGAHHIGDTSRQENLLAHLDEAEPDGQEVERRFVARRAEARGIHTGASLLVRDFNTVVLSANPLLDDPSRAGMGIRLRFGHGNAGAQRNDVPHAMTTLLDRLSLDFADADIFGQIKKQRQSSAKPSVALADGLAQPFFARPPDREAANAEPDGASDVDGRDGETARRLRAQDWTALVEAVDARLAGTRNAEILIDSTIHETALALVRDADPNTPLVIGLSSLDAELSPFFLEALIEFCIKSTSADLTVLLPSRFPRALSDMLAGRLAKHRVEIRPATKQGFWMPFVLSSKGCVIASAGLTRKIVNLSTRSTGTQVGFLLRGPGVASKVAAAVSGFVDIDAATITVLDVTTSDAGVRNYRLSEIHRKWKGCAEDNRDLNLGVSVIEEELASSGELLGDLLQAARAAKDQRFLHALLKAAAGISCSKGLVVGAPFAKALRDFADHLWLSGDDFAAAVFADHGSLGQFATNFERELAVAFASGGDFRGSVPDDLSDLQSADAVWARMGLLLLRPANIGLAEQLALHADHFPAGELGRLVKMLVERAIDFPHAPLDLATIESQLSVPDLGGAIESTRKHLDKLRSQDMGARNPTIVRDVLLRESALAGELVSIVQSPSASPAALATRTEAFFRRHLTDREFAGLRPASMEPVADEFVRKAERIKRNEAKGDPAAGENTLGGRRVQIVAPFAEALRGAYDILRSAELATRVPTELVMLDRRILACADALVRWIDGQGPAVPRPLTILQETLRYRLKGWQSNAPQPAYWRYPALMRNRSAIASRDYAALQSLILTKEWVDDADGAAELFRRLLDSHGLVEARHLLDIWPGRTKDGSEDPRLASLVEDYKNWIRRITGEISKDVRDVRRRKIRSGLSSINIDRDSADLLQALAATDLADRPEVLEEAKNTTERVKQDLEHLHSEEAKRLVARAGKDQRERVAALAEMGHLEVARVVIDTAAAPRVDAAGGAVGAAVTSWLSMAFERGADDPSLDDRLAELFGRDGEALELARCAVRLLASSSDLAEPEILDYLSRLSVVYGGPGDAVAFGDCQLKNGFWHVECLSGGLHLVAPHLVSATGTLPVLVPASRTALRGMHEDDAGEGWKEQRDKVLLISPFPTYRPLPLVCLTTRIVIGLLQNRANRHRLTKRTLFRQMDFTRLVDWRGGSEEGDELSSERLARLLQWEVSGFREPVSPEQVRRFVDDFCFDFGVDISFGRWAGEHIPTVAHDLMVHYSGGLLLNAAETLLDGMSEDNLRGQISHVGNLAKNLNPNSGLGRKLVERCLRMASRNGAPALTIKAACNLFDDLLLNADEEGEVADLTMRECLATALQSVSGIQPIDEHVRLGLAGLETSGLVRQVQRPNGARWRVNPENGAAALLKSDLL